MAKETKRVLNKWDRTRIKTETPGKKIVQQHLKDRTDINKIMAKYQKTGLIEWTRKDPGNANYGDFSEVTDYQTALQQVMEAQEAFMTLPASTRKRFGNDPGQFLEFMSDDKNKEEAIKLGLIEPPKPAPEPIKVEVTNPNPNPQKTE